MNPAAASLHCQRMLLYSARPADAWTQPLAVDHRNAPFARRAVPKTFLARF